MNKCPKCECTVTSVKVEDVSIDVEFQSKWKGFSYGCPHCRAILGVQMNPLTLNVDLVRDVKRELTGRD